MVSSIWTYQLLKISTVYHYTWRSYQMSISCSNMELIKWVSQQKQNTHIPSLNSAWSVEPTEPLEAVITFWTIFEYSSSVSGPLDGIRTPGTGVPRAELAVGTGVLRGVVKGLLRVKGTGEPMAELHALSNSCCCKHLPYANIFMTAFPVERNCPNSLPIRFDFF